MGMSDDLEAAVAAGSTMVRIGRALFGERPARGRRVVPAHLTDQALRCAGTGEGMAPSFMKKTMVYLGLLDDEYDEYDDLEDRAPRAFAATPRATSAPQEQEPPEEYGGGIEPHPHDVPRESAVPSPTAGASPAPVAPSLGRAARAGGHGDRRHGGQGARRGAHPLR